MKNKKRILSYLAISTILFNIAACDNSNPNTIVGEENEKVYASLSKEEMAKVLSAKEEMEAIKLFEEGNIQKNKINP